MLVTQWLMTYAAAIFSHFFKPTYVFIMKAYCFKPHTHLTYFYYSAPGRFTFFLLFLFFI